jgi:hypothetical protein
MFVYVRQSWQLQRAALSNMHCKLPQRTVLAKVRACDVFEVMLEKSKNQVGWSALLLKASSVSVGSAAQEATTSTMFAVLLL